MMCFLIGLLLAVMHAYMLMGKGGGTDAESRAQEEDFLIQDEISKSRLVSIKREEEEILHERDGLYVN
ncbi:hypothetical protein D5086_021638 [Populus alba]|uniref:Uncharacterized protein n=1 Tax=Populus alba TaxID=43335 RepID=A0ACC4BDB8_POPAL